MALAPIKSPIVFSHSTPITLTYLLILSLSITTTTTPILAINITTTLSSYPDFSSFTALLSSAPSLTADLAHRSSLTLLAVPNSHLSSSSVELTRHLSSSSLSDLLSYHVLLQCLSWSDLHQVTPSGVLITSLFQTTGLASSNFGSVNITRNPATNSITIHSPAPYSPSNATVLSLIKTVPYNYTIISVSTLLVPYGFDLMASETRPPPGLNITKALMDAHNFFVAASMLSASGVVEEFEADEGGAGITLFVPNDIAFSDLPPTVELQSLPADKKAVVLKFHVLHSYYPLGSLESIVNPVQPTLATEDMGAGSYTLNISRDNGSVAINTGIVQATVLQTLFDQNPVAIFGVSEVLLPREIFGKNPLAPSKPRDTDIGEAQPPESFLSPESSQAQPSYLSSPPGFRENMKSGAGAGISGLQRYALALCCIGLYLLV